MELRIIGTDLPGRDCGDGYTNVHVGIQIRREPEQIVSAEAETVTFTTEIKVVDRNGVDFRGPAVQGQPGARFVYLSWGNPTDDGDFNMFRRAKLMLDAIDHDVLDSARATGVLTARLALTDHVGMPRCAAIRPPVITWQS